MERKCIGMVNSKHTQNEKNGKICYIAAFLKSSYPCNRRKLYIDRFRGWRSAIWQFSVFSGEGVGWEGGLLYIKQGLFKVDHYYLICPRILNLYYFNSWIRRFRVMMVFLPIGGALASISEARKVLVYLNGGTDAAAWNAY